jgi:hypothetical protein
VFFLFYKIGLYQRCASVERSHPVRSGLKIFKAG